jgi:hypothetical protein
MFLWTNDLNDGTHNDGFNGLKYFMSLLYIQNRDA